MVIIAQVDLYVFEVMNHIKKTYKVKGARERTTLIEFMVTKRTKFLEYLKELHTVNGAFWMNVIQLNIFDLSEHFKVSENCLRFKFFHDSNIPGSDERLNCSNSLTSEENGFSHDNGKSSETWSSRYLPLLSLLSMSLSDILSAPLTGDQFVDCVYGVLLELEVAFAGGSATRAMALHNLNTFRETFSCKVGVVSGNLTEEKLEFKSKYIMMRKESDSYIPSPVSYDAIISPLCTILSFTYQKLCDYDQIHNFEIAKRVISIDKRLEKMFFSRITEEIEKIAHKKLLRESLLLSTEGLFTGFGEDNLIATLGHLNLSNRSPEMETNMFDESSTTDSSGEDD